MKTQVAFVAALLLACLQTAGATPITFSISTTGAGNLNGTVFSDNTLTITLVTDTANLGTDPTGPETATGTATFTISGGIGTGSFTDPIAFYDNQSAQVLGETDFVSDNDLLDEFSATYFTTYNLNASLGPIFAPIFMTSGSGNGIFSNEPTNLGPLTFTANSLDATFQAVLGTSSVPEPHSAGLVLAGAIALAVGRLFTRKLSL